MKEITTEELKYMNPFTWCGKEWFTVNAETNGKINALTASWGGFGRLWNRDVVTIYIRPQRYTREFIDESGEFSISFLEPDHKMALSFLGRVSGKDHPDKLEASGLHACHIDQIPTFEEAVLTMHCEVLYRQPLDPAFFKDPKLCDENYPNQDYSIMYIAQIKKIFQK